MSDLSTALVNRQGENRSVDQHEFARRRKGDTSDVRYICQADKVREDLNQTC